MNEDRDCMRCGETVDWSQILVGNHGFLMMGMLRLGFLVRKVVIRKMKKVKSREEMNYYYYYLCCWDHPWLLS